ncbi:MAG: DMT family transporter [Patescibacteria group bacterium]
MWFYFALATSFISAVSIILNKRILKGVSPSVLTWCTLVLATPIIAIFAIKEGVPNLNILFVAGVVGSVLFYTISQITQFRAMKIADLSAIYPLVSLGPIFTLLVAFLPPLNEKPGLIAIVGILVTLFGTYVLNVSNAKEGLLKPIKLLFENKASALMIFSVLVGSVVVVFDKLAINNTLPKSTTFVLLVENILVIVGLLPILYLKTRNFAREIFDNKKLFIILGVLNAFSTIFAFSATGGGDVGIVSTIFKAQLLFVLLFSFLFFKDRPKFETIIGSIIMILGVVLIKIGL